MMRERENRRVKRLISCRLCFEPRQNPHPTPACGRLLEQNLAVANDQCVSLDQSLCAGFGFLDGQVFRIFSAAEFFYRADVAFRFVRQANERAQIDKRGIKTRCIASGNKLCGALPEFFAADRRINRGAHVKQAGEQTRGIRFDNWNWLMKSKSRDCVRRIAANARQFANGRDICGKDFPVSILHDLGGGMKVPGAVVIAEALPSVENIVLRSARDRSEIRESAEPFTIIGDHGGDLGLVKHELGDEDRVRIASFAPG